jgi:hypothetical protein
VAGRRFQRVALGGCVSLVAAAALAGSASPAEHATVGIRVDAREFRF